jgi:hypothetical protein
MEDFVSDILRRARQAGARPFWVAGFLHPYIAGWWRVEGGAYLPSVFWVPR